MALVPYKGLILIALLAHSTQASPIDTENKAEAHNLTMKTYNPVSLTCDKPEWGHLTARGWSEARDHLHGLKGTWTKPGGDATCDRVSCSWDSAVFLCSTNPNEITHSWSDVADMFDAIESKCGIAHNGQTSDADLFTVIAAETRC
ncbi:hypothetical protein BT63DRAFT_424264 [Microthyrium microscopicum]|uniref:Ecp2 effector protein domain-containing protein n=1 Tax=Microthyrium microscopicum TaxID=703497 RepID=A0A6A6UFV7_9PEZI|nr:hypothetical protein BT63DRAFT_424264 [Microthyrium microscopicum]